MTTVQFDSNQQEQRLVDNIKAVFDAIMQTYMPVSQNYSPFFASISPFPNNKLNINLSTDADRKTASISLPLDDFETVFGLSYYSVTEELMSEYREPKNDYFDNYCKRIKAFLGTESVTVKPVTNSNTIPRLSFDITELTPDTIAGINKALQVSGLKPHAKPIATNISFSADNSKRNEYMVLVINDNCDEEWFRVTTALDFYTMEYNEVVSALKEKIVIDEDSEKVSFTLITPSNIEQVELSN